MRHLSRSAQHLQCTVHPPPLLVWIFLVGSRAQKYEMCTSTRLVDGRAQKHRPCTCRGLASSMHGKSAPSHIWSRCLVGSTAEKQEGCTWRRSASSLHSKMVSLHSWSGCVCWAARHRSRRGVPGGAQHLHCTVRRRLCTAGLDVFVGQRGTEAGGVYLEALSIFNAQGAHLAGPSHEQADALIAGGEGGHHINHWRAPTSSHMVYCHVGPVTWSIIPWVQSHGLLSCGSAVIWLLLAHSHAVTWLCRCMLLQSHSHAAT